MSFLRKVAHDLGKSLDKELKLQRETSSAVKDKITHHYQKEIENILLSESLLKLIRNKGHKGLQNWQSITFFIIHAFM